MFCFCNIIIIENKNRVLASTGGSERYYRCRRSFIRLGLKSRVEPQNVDYSLWPLTFSTVLTSHRKFITSYILL